MLLYLEGKFIQVLEGKKQEVKKLYDNIVKDTRHKRVIVVMEGNSSKRIFNGWSMGFKKLSHTEFINLTAFHDIDIFFQKQELQENSHLLLVFLKLFYKKNIVDYSEA